MWSVKWCRRESWKSFKTQKVVSQAVAFLLDEKQLRCDQAYAAMRDLWGGTALATVVVSLLFGLHFENRKSASPPAC